MALTAEKLRDGCQSLVRELTRLEQLNRPLTIANLYDWSEQQAFISKIFSEYRESIKGLHALDPRSEYLNDDLLDYLEDAFDRYTNTITPETYGVVDNAYLLAINILFDISREADDLQYSHHE
ncbi:MULTISPECIES: hypothetical protein [Escherichia]|uniref:hypothetical protein n=1 Tax=Escherichia TaxID=561 RepID=UPI0012FFF3D4|nr:MULTISPECIES: hypothetical protein [Escherichia]